MTPQSDNVFVNVTSDMRKAYTWSLSASQRWDRSGAWSAGRNVRFGFKPFDWWSGELVPNYNRSHGTAQYVTTITDPTASTTYGRRYLFAEIDQTTVSMQTRLNVTMSPRLTLSVVAEPFIASGLYGVPKELRAPRVFAFNEYGRDIGSATLNSDTRRYAIDPDGSGPAPAFSVNDNSFTTRSLNGTASLRWEWHPGATMYLVWQQRRNNPAAYGDFALRRDARGIFDRRSDNTLLFKVSYWLNP